ncbi:MAG TPA: YHS domain-containing protein [Terriglobales bacterium]|jgi:Cu+-exporting ATPase|nr:YHS domain-containing protein [Terriglobales bacterium]
MRVDPVCGMEVEETRVPQNLRSEHLGHYFYFCSQECKDEFERNPQQYVSPPAA